jgi:hypothetical protein
VATPVEHVKREYAVYLRGPAPSYPFAFALVDAYRAGIQHAGLITVIPAPSDSEENDFGILVGGGFTVELTDEASNIDWYLLHEDGSRILLEDSSGVLLLEG